MTNEELNTDLYKKMFAEHVKYRNWFLSRLLNEILRAKFRRPKVKESR